MTRLPLGLRQALEAGDCILFLGAGIAGHYKRPGGEVAPDSEQLAQQIIANFHLNIGLTDLPRVAQLAEVRNSRGDLDKFIKKVLTNLEPDDCIKWLTTFRWRAIYTTNYDRGLERAYECNPKPPQIPIPISVTANLQYTTSQINVPIFHLHGTPFPPSPSPIVITQTDYARYQAQRSMVWNRLKNDCATSTVLYIGYSGRDPNWQLIIDEISREFLPSEPPLAYRIDPYADTIDVELHKKVRKIETIPLTLQQFKDQVFAEIGDYRQDPDVVNRYKDKIPAALLDFYLATPAPMLRLLTSWQFVGAMNLTEEPNIKAFLRGATPNWSLIAQNRRFVRDVEDDLWERITEFATNPNVKSAAIAVTGPAGYGVTTILMALALKVVEARIGPVFMLREGAEVQDGDIAYAATLFPEVPCYFFVDQAREHATSLHNALMQQKQTQSNCLFVAGERKNEWLTAKTRLGAEEFYVLPLSDAEINRVLNFLADEKALGEMEHLDRDFQFQIVKNKHEKELLVVMREATAGEGVGFDAIIENEYRGIDDEHATQSFARELYLLVCCFYQHGVLIRDHLMEDVLDRRLPAIYKDIGSALEGLIEFRETDIARGEYAVRARHRIIAEIVWKKCGTHDKKETLLQTAMEKLNLTYRLDKMVFDKFIRSDDIVDTFRTLEGKTKFFETGAKHEPDNPFVLQHFARMLRKEKKLTLALAQIDVAISKDRQKTIGPLHHTRGLILADLALGEDNNDVARKWMLQGEREFRICIAARDSDDYGHSGLARLYLGWARRLKTPDDEKAEYLEKAEAAVLHGLRVVKLRTSLLIVSSEIQRELGDQPARLSKLREAVESNSASTIGRYLLARAYRQQGLPNETIKILDPVIRTEFREVNLYIEYTRAMIEIGEPIRKCAATLAQCRIDGTADPAFVGLYGGLLYMDGRYADAKKVWDDAREEGFSQEERFKPQYQPRDGDELRKRSRLPGIIDGVKPGYVFILAADGPAIISLATMVGRTVLQYGMNVTFEPSFSAKGPFAENVRLG